MSPEQIADRQRAISVYIKNFVEKEQQFQNITIICDLDSSALQIVTLYNDYAEELIRPSIDSTSDTIQNYKIIANTELAVLRIAPLIIENNEKLEKYCNAKLALDIAINILFEWNNLDESKCNEIFKHDHEIKTFLDEHLKWLYLLKPAYYYPVFSNSQVWRLFYYLLKEKTKQIT